MEIEVRSARPSDFDWLKALVVDSSLYSVGYGRDISNAEVLEQAEQDFHHVLDNEPCAVLIAYNVKNQERLGFLILNLGSHCGFTGEAISYIDSLGVEPRFWGTPAVSRLVKRAAQVTWENGMSRMLGFVSFDNRRTLAKALRLGFDVTGYEVVAACGAEGVEDMPGRDEAEKAHDVSRAERRAARGQIS